MRASLLAAVALLMALLPPADACTSTGSPAIPVHAVVTEGGKTIADVATGRDHQSNACSRSDLGMPQFDGRYLAWTAERFWVYDVNASVWLQAPHGALASGRIVTGGDGQKVLVHDLASSTGTEVEAPAGTRIRGSPQGMAYAVAVVDGAYPVDDPKSGFWLHDPVSGRWLLGREPFGGPGWPEGAMYYVAVTRDWVVMEVIGEGGRGYWAFRVADRTLHGPLPTQVPSTFSSTSGGGAGPTLVLGLVGDRLHLVRQTSGSGSHYSEAQWSIRLPDGGDAKSGGLPAPSAWGRTASFRLAPEDTATYAPPSGPNGPATDPSSSSSPLSSSSRAAAAAGLGGLAILVFALAAARRRLP